MSHFDRSAMLSAAENSVLFFRMTPEHARYFVVFAFLSALLIGLVDFYSPTGFTFSLLYSLPVVAVAWISQAKIPALGIVVWVTAIWAVADLMSDQLASEPMLLAWDTLTRLTMYSFFVFMMFKTKSLLQRERAVSRQDPLTFAYNMPAFHEIVAHELARCRRYTCPLTLAFIDVDNFRKINDKRGHTASNALLVKAARTIRSTLRESDALARVDGGEFAVLLVGCNQRAAKDIFKKIQAAMREVTDGKDPITLSIGAVTCIDTRTVEEALIKKCDQLLQAAKLNANNEVVIDRI